MSLTQRRESDLVQALLELECHVNDAGWDQPHRLFALADAAELHERAPGLLAPMDHPNQLIAVEQDLSAQTGGPTQLLAQLAWPDSVVGAALTLERIVVPTSVEQAFVDHAFIDDGGDVGDDSELVAGLAADPQRSEVRLAVAVTRDGQRMCALRFRDHDADDQVLTGTDLVDSIADALLATFDEFS